MPKNKGITESAEPEQPPMTTVAEPKSAHVSGCSCHKDSGAYCCGTSLLRVGGWHVDPLCPWRP